MEPDRLSFRVHRDQSTPVLLARKVIDDARLSAAALGVYAYTEGLDRAAPIDPDAIAARFGISRSHADMLISALVEAGHYQDTNANEAAL